MRHPFSREFAVGFEPTTIVDMCSDCIPLFQGALQALPLELSEHIFYRHSVCNYFFLHPHFLQAMMYLLWIKISGWWVSHSYVVTTFYFMLYIVLAKVIWVILCVTKQAWWLSRPCDLLTETVYIVPNFQNGLIVVEIINRNIHKWKLFNNFIYLFNYIFFVCKVIFPH